MNRKHSGIIYIAICIGCFIAGLWPFDPQPRNNLGWRPGEDGTFFGWLSIIYSGDTFDLGKSARPGSQAGDISIELYLQSEHKPAGEVGSILSLYDGELPENLVIAQWRSGLLLRTPVWNARGMRTYREVGINADLYRGMRRFIVITSGSGGTDFYVDGILARAYPKLTLRSDTLRGRLILGDAPEGNRRWAGKLFAVAIFGRPLTAKEISLHYRRWIGNRLQELSSETGLSALYFFNEWSGRTIEDHSASRNRLLIPDSYHVFRRTFLVPPWSDPRPFFSDVEDVAINIVGFVPFGFFYFLYRSRTLPGHTFRNLVLTVIVSGIISASIELIQVYLPMRFSSLTDLICNIVGSLAGALLVAVVLSFVEKRKARRIWSY